VRGSEYAINTDAGQGLFGTDGKPLIYLVQSAEKTYVTFDLVVTNPGRAQLAAARRRQCDR
jgi:hypothetical protein